MEGRLSFEEFIQRCRTQILARWVRIVRQSASSKALSLEEIVNHMPALLGSIGELVRGFALDHPGLEPLDAETHALRRLDEGFELTELISEYGALRWILLELYERECGGDVPLQEVRRLNAALDQAILTSVRSYTRARQRTLVALDRISQAALQSSGVEAFLPKLLEVLLETTGSVDSAALFRAFGDELRAIAAVGLDGVVERGFTLPFGQGFAGQVATLRRPIETNDAVHDPRVAGSVIREHGIRALYAVPMLRGDEVIGVAYVGSRTAPGFSSGDKLVIRSMVRRATELILHAELAERAEEGHAAATEALAQVQALLKAAPIGVAILDPSLRFVRVNEAMARFNGHPVAAHEGRTVEEVLGADGAGAADVLRQTLQSGEPVPNFEFISAKGERRLLGDSFPIRAERGRLLGAGWMVSDITDRKRVEEELLRAGQFRETFIGIVSHDLRNPLNAITATASHLLQDEALAPTHTRGIRRIQNAAERMARMIRDLLDFTRGRLGGGMPIEYRTFDFASICRGVAEELQVNHPDRRVLLHAEGGLVGQWDPDRVAQLVGNLVKNAIDYSAAQTPVTLTVTGTPDHVRLRVHNEGGPIPPEVLPTLFEPFHGSERAASSRREPGLGLGLHIAHEIVEAHCGTITVQSSASAGTTFTVELPRTACHTTASPTAGVP